MDNNPFNTGFTSLVGRIAKTEYFQPERKKDKPYGEITIRVKDFGFQELINRIEKDADLIIQIQS